MTRGEVDRDGVGNDNDHNVNDDVDNVEGKRKACHTYLFSLHGLTDALNIILWEG